MLSNYPFLRLWIAQAVSQTANSMVDFSLLLRVGQTVDYHDVAQANTAVSFVILAFSLARGGRSNRRCRCGSGESAKPDGCHQCCARGTGGALLTRTADLAGSDRARLLLLCIVPLGAVGQFFMPAQGASIPALVPRDQLTAANALFNLTFTATQLLGFAILGPLLSQALGVDMLFIVTMIAFAISALLTLWLPPMPIPPRVVSVERVSAIRRVWSDIHEGLVYIRQDAILTKAIAYLTFATTIFMLIAALAPNFVATVVGVPPGDIGYLVAPAGIGVIVGVVLVPRLASRFRAMR